MTRPRRWCAQMMRPNPKPFCEHINYYDCSKVSDGASAIIVASEEGLKRLGIEKRQAVELVGYGVSVADLTKPPPDLTRMTTVKSAVDKAYAMSGIGPDTVGLAEIHDCFTIGGILEVEAAGFAGYGEGLKKSKQGGTAMKRLVLGVGIGL